MNCINYVQGMELREGDTVLCTPYSETSYTVAKIIERKDEIEYWAVDTSNNLRIRLDDSTIVGVALNADI